MRHQQDCGSNNIPTKQNRHVCIYPHCGWSFKRFEHLKRHMLVHTGERSHACPFPGCGKRFSRSDNLHAHHRTHMRKRMRQQQKSQEDVEFAPKETAFRPPNCLLDPVKLPSNKPSFLSLPPGQQRVYDMRDMPPGQAHFYPPHSLSSSISATPTNACADIDGSGTRATVADTSSCRSVQDVYAPEHLSVMSNDTSKHSHMMMPSEGEGKYAHGHFLSGMAAYPSDTSQEPYTYPYHQQRRSPSEKSSPNTRHFYPKVAS